MAKYKIDESFELIGSFWTPGNPEDRFSGTLACKKGTHKLKTSPKYQELDQDTLRTAFREVGSQGRMGRLGTVHGYTTDKICTLFDVYELSSDGLTHFGDRVSLTARRFRATVAVMGLHLDSPEFVGLDSAAFYFNKIRSFLPTPWSWRFGEENITYTVPVRAINVFRVSSIALQAEIICEVFAGGSNHIKKGATIQPVSRIRIIPNDLKSFDWFSALTFRLENFFTLLLGSSVSIQRVQVFSGNEIGSVVRKVRRRNEKTRREGWVKCQPHRIAEAICNWLFVPEEQRPIELTLLGSLRKSSLFAETEFLTLAQALEGFGRIRFAPARPRQAKFADLISKSYDLLSPDFALKLLGEKKEFVLRLLNTRDFYTHLGGKSGKWVLTDGGDLFLFIQRLHAFLRCVMLLGLGFTEDELRDAITYQAFKWKVW
jgi:ApeA N-terminal domain 1